MPAPVFVLNSFTIAAVIAMSIPPKSNVNYTVRRKVRSKGSLPSYTNHSVLKEQTILFCCFFFSCFSTFSGAFFRLFALVAFEDSVSDFAGQEFDSADSVVVSRNRIVDDIGIAVGVNRSDDGDVKFTSFGNSDFFFFGSMMKRASGSFFMSLMPPRYF